MSSELIKDELEAIRSANPRGELVPSEVVAFARNPNTAIHNRFNWDDSEAANLYRLQQARTLIRVVVSVTGNEGGMKLLTPKFVSLSTNRGSDRGYKPRVDVISDNEMRRRHVLDVLTSVIGILERANLDELRPVLDVAKASKVLAEADRAA